MKKLSIALNFLFLIIIIILLCWLWKGKKTALVAKDNNTTSCMPCKDYSNDPFTGIKLETAREMAGLYRNNHYSLYNNARGTTDALSVWFSLDTLKKFIWAIENNLCKQDCGNRLTLGVRMYYGEYPSDVQSGAAANRNPDYTTIKNSYAGLHTIFMVPTYFDRGYDWDFNPLSAVTDCKPQPLTEYLSGGNIQPNKRDTAFLKQQALIMFAGPGSNNAAQNHGNMIPPDNATGTAF